MTIHLAFPPTQAKLDEIADKFRRASRMFCDATDGAIQINEFTLERNGLSASQADVIWLPGGTVSRVMVSGRLPYGHAGKRLRAHDHVPFRTLAHEFGHLVVGLRDNYDEQRRFGSGCGIGPAIEAEDWDERNHSIMQKYQTRCALEDGDDIRYEHPAEDDPGCNIDSDCTRRLGYYCYEFTDIASELSTPLIFDFVRGDGTGFPGPRAGTALLLDMVLGDRLEPDRWTPATRTIEYINSAGTSFEVAFEAKRSSRTGAWSLRASIDDTRLKWKVGRVIETAIELSFGATADCGNSLGNLPNSTIANYYFLERINGRPDPELSLLLPPSVTGQDRDVAIEVITTDLCEGRGKSRVYIPPSDVNWQPDGVGRGAYFGAVGQGAPSSEPIYQQLAVCSDPDRNSRWNRITQRFETSDQYLFVHRTMAARGYRVGDPEYRVLQGAPIEVGGSDWELMEYQLKYGWPAMVRSFEPVDIGWASPVNHDVKLLSSPPVADNRADCDYPIRVDTSKIDVPDSVALVLDRSGSMGREWKVGGRGQSRIEWARKGAAGFVQAADGQGIKLVVMDFAVEQEVLVWPSIIDSTAPRDLPGYIHPDEVARRLAGIEPKGATAIYDAIDGAFKTLPSGHKNAVLVLTDGEDNRSTLPVEWVSADSIEFGIPVFVTPIGDFSGSKLHKLASESGGELLAQVSPDEIPAAFFEMRAKLRGEQLSLHATSKLSQGDLQLLAEAHHTVLVEPAAERLLLMITPDTYSQPTWDLDFQLRGPWGEVIDARDLAHVHADPDGYYVLITVPGPSAGIWTLDLAAPHSETPKPVPEAQLALAHIEHDGPRCLATTVVNHITSHADTVEIIAEASWGQQIDEGVSFAASVRRPDNTWVDTPMIRGSDGLGHASFQDYSSDGGYEVRVRCEVSPAASYALGEGADPSDHRRQRVPAGFDRLATTHFLLTTSPPVGPLGPDGECVEDEPSTHVDRLACDSDSEDDELLNGREGVTIPSLYTRGAEPQSGR